MCYAFQDKHVPSSGTELIKEGTAYAGWYAAAHLRIDKIKEPFANTPACLTYPNQGSVVPFSPGIQEPHFLTRSTI